MLKSWISLLPPAGRAAFFIAILLVIGGIAQSITYTIQYGGNDLRTRIVGARLLNTNGSPYFYKWAPGDAEQLADPFCRRYGIPANGLTITPGFLYAHYPLASLPYPAIHAGWNLIQYLLCLCILGFVLSMGDSTPMNKLYVIVVGGIFFLNSNIWLFNIEAGQAYIIFPFCMCLLYYLHAKKTKWSLFLAGVVLALVTYCRPNFLLFGLPLVLGFNKRFLAGLCAAGTLLLVDGYMHFNLWKEYFEAMAMHTGLNDNSTLISDGTVAYPAIIEGATNASVFKVLDVAGLPPLRWAFDRYHLHEKYVYIALYAAIASFVLFHFRDLIRKKDITSIFLIGFLLYIISEICIPATRGGYNLVQWIFPVALMLNSRKITAQQVTLIVTGLCLVAGFPLSIRFSHSCGELLLMYVLISYIKGNASPASGGRG